MKGGKAIGKGHEVTIEGCLVAMDASGQPVFIELDSLTVVLLPIFTGGRPRTRPAARARAPRAGLDRVRRFCYDGHMKVKTSISISQETLDELDGYVSNDNNRSVLIQQAVDSWLAQRRRKARDERDVRIINENAEALNREMSEVLEFQVWE